MMQYETCFDCRMRLPRRDLIPKYPQYNLLGVDVPKVCKSCTPRETLETLYDTLRTRR